MTRVLALFAILATFLTHNVGSTQCDSLVWPLAVRPSLGTHYVYLQAVDYNEANGDLATSGMVVHGTFYELTTMVMSTTSLTDGHPTIYWHLSFELTDEDDLAALKFSPDGTSLLLAINGDIVPSIFHLGVYSNVRTATPTLQLYKVTVDATATYDSYFSSQMVHFEDATNVYIAFGAPDLDPNPRYNVAQLDLDGASPTVVWNNRNADTNAIKA